MSIKGGNLPPSNPGPYSPGDPAYPSPGNSELSTAEQWRRVEAQANKVLADNYLRDFNQWHYNRLNGLVQNIAEPGEPPQALMAQLGDPKNPYSWTLVPSGTPVVAKPDAPKDKPSMGGVVWGPGGPVGPNAPATSGAGHFSLGKNMPGTTYFAVQPDDTTPDGSEHDVKDESGNVMFRVRKKRTPFGGMYETIPAAAPVVSPEHGVMPTVDISKPLAAQTGTGQPPASHPKQTDPNGPVNPNPMANVLNPKKH